MHAFKNLKNDDALIKYFLDVRLKIMYNTNSKA